MEQKQNQKTGTPGTDRGPLEQGGDDRLKELAKQAKGLKAKIEENKTPEQLDPRRSMQIDVSYGDTRSLLYINGTLWAEVDWSASRNAFCIQDCLGYCLNHVEHIVKEISSDEVVARRFSRGEATPSDVLQIREGMKGAIGVAKQMIRDGSMRSPEEARQFAIANNTSGRNHKP